jgi:hypothetical protein
VDELAAAGERIRVVQDELEDRTRWALDLDARVEKLTARLAMFEASRWVKLGRKLNAGPKFEEGE